MKIGNIKGLQLLLLLLITAFGLTACNNEVNGGDYISAFAALGISDAPVEPVQEEIVEKDPTVRLQGLPMPSIYIGISADDIRRDEWTRGISVSLRGAGEEFDFEDRVARIRGRGNASWWAMGEKRPIRIRLETPISMFGTEYIARDWILLANSIDYSHMRTVGAFDLGARLGRFDFSPIPTMFVHVYLDGDYRGVYQFTDYMQRYPGRVEVEFHRDPALSEYYIEWCRHGRKPDDVFFYVGDIPFIVHYPNADDMTPEHVKFVSDFTNKVNQALIGGVFDEVAALIDIPTFVDFYLVNEFTKNADIFFSSVHLTVKLDENGGHRLYAGPLWDFDQSAGGTFDDFYPDYSPQGAWAAYRSEWFRRLMRIPEFVEIVAERWFEIRDVEVAETLAEIRYLTTTYRGDFERNFERWTNKLGQYLWRTPPAMQVIDTYEGQVDYLLDWYEQRIIWMDEFLR